MNRNSSEKRLTGQTGRFLNFEILEERCLLAIVTWDNEGSDGAWSNPLNWSNDNLPGKDDEVLITQNDLPIAVSSGQFEIRKLVLETNLDVDNGSIEVHDDFILRNASLTVRGASSSFAVNGDSMIDDADIRVQNRALAAFVGPTTNVPGNRDRTFRAEGTGSVLDLSGLTELTGPNGNWVQLYVQSADGGSIDLSSVQTITVPEGGSGSLNRGVEMLADGVGSIIDLSSVSEFADRSSAPGSLLEADNGGSISMPNLTMLTGVNEVETMVHSTRLKLPKSSMERSAFSEGIQTSRM